MAPDTGGSDSHDTMDEIAQLEPRQYTTQLNLISAHFRRIAARLRAEGNAARSLHHGVNQGLVREAFVREFLNENTSDLWGIGSGEIIHSGSSPDGKRNQIDVVVHNRMHPKISVSSGIDLFPVESVSSFIEVKSTLRKGHLESIAKATKIIKSNAQLEPQPFNPSGKVNNPRPYSFVFAYSGPKSITTVLKWMKDVSEYDDYGLDRLKTTHPGKRGFFGHTFIDGVFLLDRGFVLVDSQPFRSFLANRDDVNDLLDHIWVTLDEEELTVLWIVINLLNRALLWNDLDLSGYLGRFGLTYHD